MRAKANQKQTNPGFRCRVAGAFLRICLPALALLLLPCSGRAAVIAATEAALRSALTTGGDIRFSSNATIALTQQLVVATNAVVDAGSNSVTISGGNKVRLFSVQGASLTLTGLRLVSGRSQNGGAVSVSADGALMASNCTFSGNSAQGSNGAAGAAGATNNAGSGGDGDDGTAGHAGWGGAIFSRGTVTLLDCTLATNTATGGNGGAGGKGGNGRWNGGNGGHGAAGGMGLGGAVYNLGTLTVVDSTISDNSATGGNGGAGGAGGTGAPPGLTGQGGPGAAGSGGGICNGLNLSVSGSTFARNTTRGGDSAANGTQPNDNGYPGLNGGDGAGGGLCTLYRGAITNSTFSGNKATGGSGGTGGSGRWNAGDGGNGGNGVGGGIQNGGGLVLVNCTLVRSGAYGGTNGVAGIGSSPGKDGAAGHPWGGNVASTSGNCLLLNSIIAWEAFGACGYGDFTDGGFNLTTDTSIALGSTSFPNISQPKLSALGQFGGPTATIALLPGSPAIDKIPPELAPGIDQRGVTRPLGDQSDIGAVEYDASNSVVRVSGSVTEGTLGVPGVNLAVGSTAAATDANGNFGVTVPNGSHTVTPTRDGYVFQPSNMSITVPPAPDTLSFAAIPLMSASTGTNNVLHLSAGGITGVVYTLQVSTNLTDWRGILTNAAPIQFSEGASNTERFYRIVR